MRKKTTEEFISQARAVHGNRYDYSQAVYTAAHAKVKIVCPDHGVFEQSAHAHAGIMSQGCRKCGMVQAHKKHTLTTEEFIERASRVHGDRYDYSLSVSAGAKNKITVVCREHGEFLISAWDHMEGRGCKRCGWARIASFQSRDTEHFIRKARSVHGEKFSYGRTEYIDVNTHVTITCPTHGDYQQDPSEHYRGRGCHRCALSGPSEFEIQILEYVQSLCPDAVGSDRNVIRPKELDVFVPSQMVAIECNGVHFHSDKYKKKNEHRDKSIAAAAVDVRLIHITDVDWGSRRPQMERLIRNALNKSTDVKINARQTVCEEIPAKEANTFLENWHPQGKGAAGVRAFGLRHPEHGLCAVMTFAIDAYRRNPADIEVRHKGEWDLCRYTTSASVRGGASKLFKAAVVALDMHACQSFSSNDWFGGALYATLGFTKGSDIDPDYRVFHRKTGLRGKSAWRRTSIPARLKEIGSDVSFDPSTDRRTEWMIQDAVGAKRIFDSGKVRWHWTR